MRSIFAGMIMLSASMAVVDTAQAQIHPERPSGYESMQYLAHAFRTGTQQECPLRDRSETVSRGDGQLACGRVGTAGQLPVFAPSRQ
jgi:hypothetical protein